MALGGLQLQAFIDQTAQDLLAKTAPCLRAVLQTGRRNHQADALFHIVAGDNLVVDDGRNPLDVLGQCRRRE